MINKKRKTMKKIILIIIFLLSSNILFSQEEKPDYWIGANAGLNINMNIAEFQKLPGYECCSEGFGNSNGLSYYLGLLFKYEIQDNLKLDLRLNFRPYGGSFSETQKIGNAQIIGTNGSTEVGDAKSQYTIDPSMNIFGLDIGLDYMFFKNISVLGGINPNYILNATFNQEEKLVSPNNVVFKENESKVRNTYSDAEILELNAFQFQVFAGLAYGYELKKDNFLNFEVKYYQSLTNITSIDWTVNNLFIGASYQYPIYPKKDIEVINDTIYQRDTLNLIVNNEDEVGLNLVSENVLNKDTQKSENIVRNTVTIQENYENKVFEKTQIDASLRVYGIDTDGSIQDVPTITIEEIESEEGFPVLPYVFFDYGESSLKSTSQNLLNKNDVSNFDENNLDWDVFDIYNNNLNIIAKRIIENNQSIQLIGNRIVSTNNVQDSELINKRLSDIESYLTENWGISKNKIKRKIVDVDLKDAKENDDLFKEASRVELISEDTKVIQPVYLKEIIKSSNPPKVGVDLEVISKNPPISWDLSIAQENNKLREYNGNDLKSSKIWNITEEPIPSLEKDILFTLNAKDKFGSEKTITEKVGIKQLTIRKKREVLKDDKKLEKYSLIIFDYNSAELKQNHIDVINKVIENIKPNSTVTIAGYADRTGDREYNKKLAERRINAIMNLIKVPAKEYIKIPYGNSVLLYDNDTEVGRSLSRTVQITIETPVK